MLVLIKDSEGKGSGFFFCAKITIRIILGLISKIIHKVGMILQEIRLIY